MSDDFQRDALAPLMCPRHDCESTQHALNQLRVENKHLRAEIERLQQERDALFRTACRLAPRADEIERLQRERDALAAKVASYERADRDLNEALNMGDGSYRP